MNRLLSFILVCSLFFMGYYMGHLPGSPDLTPYARKCYVRGAAAYERTVLWLQCELEKLNTSWTKEASAAEQQPAQKGS